MLYLNVYSDVCHLYLNKMDFFNLKKHIILLLLICLFSLTEAPYFLVISHLHVQVKSNYQRVKL